MPLTSDLLLLLFLLLQTKASSLFQCPGCSQTTEALEGAAGEITSADKTFFHQKNFPDFTHKPLFEPDDCLFYFIQTYKRTVTSADETALYKLVSFIRVSKNRNLKCDVCPPKNDVDVVTGIVLD